MNNTIQKLRGGLVVSCQAFKGEPMFGDDNMTRFAITAESGGASALRANGPSSIRLMKKHTTIPIFGIYKLIPKNYEKLNDVIITPNIAVAKEVYEAGADILAIDCTFRDYRGKDEISDLIKSIRSYVPIPIMGEISTLEEAMFIDSCGVDMISTTVAGYTMYSKETCGPDFDLIKSIVNHTDTPVNAEGRFNTPEEVRKAIDIGAWTVTVGSSITRPHVITKNFILNRKV